MSSYITFYQKVKLLIESNTDLKELIYTNAKYLGKISEMELMQIFGKPYYCLHPFILERLPPIYFTYKKAYIALCNIRPMGC